MLTRLASREPLQTLLDELAAFVSSLCPGAMSSLMLFDSAAGVLRAAAAHGIPPEVQSASDPTAVQEGAGICGTAAARRAPVVVEDIATDPAFAGYAEITRRFALRAAWSHPFFDTEGRVLGTVAMYVREARRPTSLEVEVTTFAATLAGVMVERARNLEALHDRETRLRLIFESGPECVKVLDADGGLLEMNPAGLRLIEADSIAQVRGAPVGNLVMPEHRERFVALTRAVALGGEGSLEFEITGLKGTRRWLETHAVPLRDTHGRITAVLGITRDVTERKTLAAQLLQAQKLESVGRLAGGVAHDFNNMLSVIQGQTELALQDLPPGSALAEHLREVLEAAQRSAVLTRQLLAFARREPSAPRVIDLNARIQDVMGMLARIIGEGVTVAWQPQPGVWPVRIDPGQLDQILTNLAVNARDAMGGSGTLTVKVGNVARAAEGAEVRDYALLTVTDTGVGMDAETQGRIFEPFFTTKPLGQGTGLGLSTVYGIARQNGGAVEVESAPGQGATFRLFLPRCADEAPARAEPAGRRQSVGGRETILVVEDEPSLLALVGRVLRRAGYQVLEARSPDDAEALVRQHDGPINLVLTDMVMPGMTGRELWRRVKPLRPGLHCLIMSGYSREAVEVGGDLDVPMLHKPFPMTALVDKVRAVLDGPPVQA